MPRPSNSRFCAPEECADIYPYIARAGALKDWGGPEEGRERPAYIVIACDLAIGKNKQWDDGITAQTIMLAAVEKGIRRMYDWQLHAVRDWPAPGT